MRNQGARLHIGQGSFVHCPGNIEIKDQHSSFAKFELEGELILKGNFLNQTLSKTQLEVGSSSGCLRMSAEGKTQTLGGVNEIYLQHLILDNPMGLRLEKDVHVFGKLRLQEGKIYTGIQKLILHDPEVDAISGFGESRYVVGNMRRYISRGQTHFPIGSQTDLQLLSLDFEVEPALLFIDASFDGQAAQLIEDIEVDNGRINSLLDNGTWTLYSPQMPMQAFQLSLTSRAHSNANQITGSYSLLIDKGFGWELVGELDRAASQGAGQGPIRSSRSNIMSWGKFSIGQANYALAIPQTLPFEQILLSNNGSPQREVSLSFFSNKASTYRIEIRDLKGSLLKEMKANASAGQNLKKINLQDFPQAVYVLTLEREGLFFQEKIW
ncbi:MAG: hypothetical protein AAF696_29835 [Bacteroidota bacterium]